MVSVIIPTITGGLAHLVKLIPTLVNEPDIEIIVVDNASKDGTTQYLSNHRCKIIVNTEKFPFAKSNNQAAKIAQGEYLLFLNNDTQLTKQGTIEKLKQTFNLDPKIAVVGCLLKKMDNSNLIQHAGVVFNSDMIPYELGMLNPVVPKIAENDPRARAVHRIPSVTAACMMVKKSVFDEVGGFDERYMTGWEDTDLVLRIREKGYEVWYNGQVEVLHLHFGSKDRGRFTYEQQNRQLFDNIWVHTKRAETILKGFTTV